MRRYLFLLLLLPTFAFAQTRQDGWVDYPDHGCIGGSSCAERRLRVAIDDLPVVSVRFKAHDQVGAKAEGALRVKIDGNVVEGYIDIPRAGKTFTIDVDELRGRYLIFEPASDDEVEISEIAVLYGRETSTRGPRGTPGGGAWRPYPRSGACIGGNECRKNGTRITIALEDAPVLGIRFHAHDSIGARADGRLSVRIDETAINSYIDVRRAGMLHELEVESVRGTRLVIEAATDDEVEVKDIEVLYGRTRRSERRQREASHEGGCIGGSDCGGKRARIRVALYGRGVQSVRFYARDDVGERAGGELRIRVDDEVLRDYLDIPREGRTFTIDGRGVVGDYLIIEPAEDDEVVVRDVRVTFAPEED